MVQYLISCTGCQIELIAATKDAVASMALDHLSHVHENMVFPSPALDMLRVHEFSTFDYPTQYDELKAGIPSQALVPVAGREAEVSLTVPDPSKITF